MKINADVTILFSRDGMKIEVNDKDSVTQFLRINLNQEQTCQILSRLAHTDCCCEVRGLQNVGKMREWADTIQFRMPECGYEEREEIAYQEALKVCPDGWEPSRYFNSQESFFYDKDRAWWGRTHIYRWVEKETLG